MKLPTAPVSTFNTDWSKIRGWAASQKLPETAVNNVYTLDQARLSEGTYAMSNAERTRAILAASGQNYNTALPSDKPAASNIFGNTLSNVRAIATGLMPTRLVANLFDTVKETAHALEDPASMQGKTETATLANYATKTLLSWLPGVYDVGTALNADKRNPDPFSALFSTAAFDALAKQPVTTALDVMPALKFVDAGVGSEVARTAVGSAISDRLGITPQRLGQMGGVRIAGKAFGSIRPKLGGSGVLKDIDGNIITDEHGAPTIGIRTLSQRASDRATTMGFGKVLGGLAHLLHTGNNEATDIFRRQIKPLREAVAKLSPDQHLSDGSIVPGTLSQFNDVMHSGRPVDQILEDESIPVEVRTAVQAYQPIAELHLKTMIDAGEIVPVTLRDGSTALYERTSPVLDQVRQADEAHAAADAANEATDKLVATSKALDSAGVPLMQRTTEIKDGIAGTVVMQPQLSGQYLAMFGRLTGKGGLIEQMQDAVNRQDWVELRRVAKKADKMMDSVYVTGRETIDLRVGPGHEHLADDPAYLEGYRAFKAGKKSPDVPAANRTADYEDKWNKGMNDARHAGPASRVVPAIQGWESVPVLNELRGNIQMLYKYGQTRAELLKKYDNAYNGRFQNSYKKSAKYLNKKAAEADEKVMKSVRRNWQGQYRDVVLNSFFKNFLQSDKAEASLNESAAYLKKEGYDEQQVDALRRENPRKLWEIIVAVADPTFRDPFLPEMTPEDHAIFMENALNEADMLRATGTPPMWVPTISGKTVKDAEADDRIYVNPMKYPTVDSAFAKSRDMSSTINDVMLGVSRSMKQPLERHVVLEFAEHGIKPMLMAQAKLRLAVGREHIGAARAATSASGGGFLDDAINRQYGMSVFDIPRQLGIKNSDMGLDDNEIYYMPSNMRKQIETMVGRDQFPLKGAWDKTTGVFKYSILGLSPRYTAHILFGGSLMMALRIDPRSLAMIGQAAKLVQRLPRGRCRRQIQFGDPGGGPAGIAGRPGSTTSVVRRWAGSTCRSGSSITASRSTWPRRPTMPRRPPTSTSSSPTTSATCNGPSAYLDGIKKAERQGFLHDPITGERIQMTAERAHGKA